MNKDLQLAFQLASSSASGRPAMFQLTFTSTGVVSASRIGTDQAPEKWEVANAAVILVGVLIPSVEDIE